MSCIRSKITMSNCICKFYASNPKILANFVDFYGNKSKRTHFVAMRFKRRVIVYKSNPLDSVPIEPPDNSIIVVHGACPPINVTNKSILLFTLGVNSIPGIRVADDSEQTLIRALFPPEKLLFSHFHYHTLFFAAHDNPYFRITHRCRREAAFKTLCALLEARLLRRPLTLEEVSNLRLFKSSKDLKQFNKWKNFAFELCSESFVMTTYSHPSAFFGKEVYQILKRSNVAPGPLPPSDFYQCEIFFTDTEPLGVMCLVSNERDRAVQYVSPMVVMKPKDQFRDSNSVICNTWFPFYRNKETWNTFSLAFYIHGLRYKKFQLQNILSWLQLQTSEKYKFIYLDLLQVFKILFGDETRCFLKP